MLDFARWEVAAQADGGVMSDSTAQLMTPPSPYDDDTSSTLRMRRIMTDASVAYP